MLNPTFWRGKKVFLTGHTGFKGGWATAWLHQMGAEVTGFALPPETSPSLFEMIGVEGLCKESIFGDIRDLQAVTEAMRRTNPDIVLHMAAQALVSEGYQDPVRTFQTNVMGTVHILETVRTIGTHVVCLVVSSDKCYENPENGLPLREGDPMGGHDPYSASKGACEIATWAYGRSFFNKDDTPRVASARAGNVIGGGDWANNRLLPDAFRAFSNEEKLVIRNPIAKRPWQHVCEPLSGYFLLIEKLSGDFSHGQGWNFGPVPAFDASVQEVVELACEAWGEDAGYELSGNEQSWKEANNLLLDSTAAVRFLDWSPRLTLKESVSTTMDWYRFYHRHGGGNQLLEYTMDALDQYRAKEPTIATH
jgi:CDP-glucose 4,6-dehydratase